LRPDQILAPEREAIQSKYLAEFIGGDIDEALDRVGHFRPPGTAIGLRWHGVGKDRERAQMRRRNGIGAGDEPCPFAQRRQRNATRADIADIGGAHCEYAAVFVQRQRDFGDEIATLVITQKGFGARCGEFHRTADFLRRP
jgi:hypothetical protein